MECGLGYVPMLDGSYQGKWTHPTPKVAIPHTEEHKTVEEYTARLMHHLSPFIVHVIGSTPSSVSINHLHAMVEEMQISRAYWPKLTTLVKGEVQDDAMDST